MKRTDPLLKKGLKTRSEVLGKSYVDQSFQSATQYTKDLVEITTKAAWGLVWSRPGLSRKSRSLLNLGALIALGQPHELRLHIRGALNNGLTRQEIAESVIHCAIYTGFPRAAEARRAMTEVFEQIDKAKGEKSARKLAKRK